jgi:hypothetical protein
MTRLGEIGRGFELVQEAVRRRDAFVPFLARDERYDPLRELAGFSALLRELRLEPSWDVTEEDEPGLARR